MSREGPSAMGGETRAALSRSRFLLAIATIAATTAAYFLSSQQPPVYEASALLQVVSGRQVSGEFVTGDELLHLTNVMARVAKTRVVARRAAERGPGDAGEYRKVDVSAEAEVEVLRVAAQDHSPARAAGIANAYASTILEYVEEQQEASRQQDVRRLEERIAGVTTAAAPRSPTAGAPPEPQLAALQTKLAERLARSPDGLRVLEPAVPPAAPVSPSPVRDAALAGVAVLALGLVTVYLRTAFSDRFSSLEEITRLLDLPALGELPRGRTSKAVQEEAFRSLRTSLDFALRSHERPVVLITSGHSGAGKTHVVANLARSFAAEGRRVVAVDSDLRRPTLHSQLQVPLEPGLGELLSSDHRGAAELQVSEVALPSSSRRGGDLDVVAAGGGVPDPAEALASTRMERAIGALQSNYDAVLLDSPPLLGVADALVLCRHASAVVLVIDRRRDGRISTRRAIEMLRSIKAPLTGFVFNGGIGSGRLYGNYGNRVPSRPLPHALPRSGTGS